MTMWRTLLVGVLWLATVATHAADTTLYFGPDGKPLAAGKYWRVTVGFANGVPVVTQTVLFEIGDVPPPPPPPVNDVATKVKALIDAVTTDAEKGSTAKGIAEAYKQVLEKTAGLVTDANTLRKIAETLIDAALADPKINKATQWKPFTDGMKSLTATMDFAALVSAYTIAQAQLAGVPVPPPPPPPSTAVKALILLESETQSPQQAQLLTALRNDKAWSKKVELIDPQAKNEKGQPDPLAQAAVKAVGSQTLPRLLLLDAAGSFVGVEPMPGTWAELKTVLTAKGVKP